VTTTPEASDRIHMQAALGLARRALGMAWPNPAVGCVLTRPDLGGRVVGRGWTQAGGRPHAETEALRRAGAAARGATAYVTLEPCVHQGRTPPCCDALIAAGVRRVLAAFEDPDPRVAGRGFERLRAAGIAVKVGPCAEEAARLNAGFLMRARQGRPLFTLKLATSLDGRIATASGASRWITGEEARARAHLLRARHDAVMIGAGTARADDPALTVRLPGLEGQARIRIVADSEARLAPESRLVSTARQCPLWILVARQAPKGRRHALENRGALVVEIENDAEGGIDLPSAAAALGAAGLTRVLVEGGGRLAAGLLAAGLVDRVAWFFAPKIIGGDGVPAVAELRLADVTAADRFSGAELSLHGDDFLASLEKDD
jgi:diaminohydroxyphosphoribosylaminopyrimidine deaminase / 5-amino-6-(5-phosphoribosylamino)uracil reductase